MRRRIQSTTSQNSIAEFEPGGFVIYPGKLTTGGTFRVGRKVALRCADIRRAVEAIAATALEMGIEVMAPTSPSKMAG